MNRKFDSIIFDLGGVIINLDEERTIQKFSAFSLLTVGEIRERILKFDTYFDFETGKISETNFRNEVRNQFKVEATDEEVDECLNAMLLDIPIERLNLLQSLKPRFNLFLLSNTNSIHLRKFNEIIYHTASVKSIDPYFNRAYYSHLVGLRKPNQEIFEKVLEENKLNPSTTLFIDDNQANIEAADQVGILTHHLTKSAQLFELFR